MINNNTLIGGGVDYDSGPYTVTFPAGNASVSFNVNISIDHLVEDGEKFYLTIDPSSLPTGVIISSPHQTNVKIVDNDSKFVCNLLLSNKLRVTWGGLVWL